MRRISKFFMFIEKSIWWCVASPKVKSFYSLKRTHFIEHTCKYTGDYKMFGGFPFIKCIHYGCSCYYPVDCDANDFGGITKKLYLTKRLEFFQNMLANWQYSSYSHNLDIAATEYLNTMIKSCKNDIIRYEFDGYNAMIQEAFKLPYDQQPKQKVSEWLKKCNELVDQMKTTA